MPGQTREEKLAKVRLLLASMAGVMTTVRVTSSPERREHMLTEARKFFVKNFTER
jgi:TetR/AcrR family transcriptional repressor of nem operon